MLLLCIDPRGIISLIPGDEEEAIEFKNSLNKRYLNNSWDQMWNLANKWQTLKEDDVCSWSGIKKKVDFHLKYT